MPELLLYIKFLHQVQRPFLTNGDFEIHLFLLSLSIYSISLYLSIYLSIHLSIDLLLVALILGGFFLDCLVPPSGAVRERNAWPTWHL